MNHFEESVIRDYQPPTDALRDRIIMITGAGSGIGRAVALAAAGAGARVILLGRTQSKLEQLYDDILAAGGPRPSIAVLDLARADGPQYFALAETIGGEFGRLDGLLHNAAMLGQRAPIEHYDVGTWHQVMHLNLTVPFVLTQVLLPLLRKSTDASILFTSSGVGKRGKAFWGAYAVSKFGVEGLSQVLAEELGDASRIRVNCINPGRARTAMRRAAYPAEDAAALPDPAALTGPYLYLLGPAGRGVTGTSLECQSR